MFTDIHRFRSNSLLVLRFSHSLCPTFLGRAPRASLSSVIISSSHPGHIPAVSNISALYYTCNMNFSRQTPPPGPNDNSLETPQHKRTPSSDSAEGNREASNTTSHSILSTWSRDSSSLGAARSPAMTKVRPLPPHHHQSLRVSPPTVTILHLQDQHVLLC